MSRIRALDYETPNAVSWHGYSEGPCCLMCSEVLRDLSREAAGRIDPFERSHYRAVRVDVCSRCGWAQADADFVSEDYRGKYVTPARSTGCLQQFEVSDPDAPAHYLLSLIESEPALAKCVSPRKMEEIVAYVFSQLGYKVVPGSPLNRSISMAGSLDHVPRWADDRTFAEAWVATFGVARLQ